MFRGHGDGVNRAYLAPHGCDKNGETAGRPGGLVSASGVLSAVVPAVVPAGMHLDEVVRHLLLLGRQARIQRPESVY